MADETVANLISIGKQTFQKLNDLGYKDVISHNSAKKQQFKSQ